MKHFTATANDFLTEEWFLAEQKRQQKKVLIDEADLEPFETYSENYGESPADLSGDSADDILAEMLMGLSFQPDDDSREESSDEEEGLTSRSWTELELGSEVM